MLEFFCYYLSILVDCVDIRTLGQCVGYGFRYKVVDGYFDVFCFQSTPDVVEFVDIDVYAGIGMGDVALNRTMKKY